MSPQLRSAGYQIGYEDRGGPSAPAILLLPVWQIVHSRHWKMQVPYLSRFFRVITYDPPGNGGGERTLDSAAYEYDRIVDQGIELLDHLGVARAAVVGLSLGVTLGVWMAARYPERVSRLVLIGGDVDPDWPPPLAPDFETPRATYAGWEKFNAPYWREHYADFVAFFFAQALPEPHSTKALDDCLAWGLQTTPEILVGTVNKPELNPRLPVQEALARIRCPVLLMHGDADSINPIKYTRRLAEARPDWEFLVLEGCGHLPHVRDAVRVNLALAEFLGRA